MNVLVVDDSPTIRTLLELALDNVGYTVFQAGNAEEAVVMIKEKGPFPLGIFDVNMPGKSGIELIQEVLSMQGSENMKIVVLTTESSEEMKKAGKDSGAKAWLLKPFEEDSLMKVINKLASM